MKTLKTSFFYIVLIGIICLPSSLVGQENNDVPSHEGFFLRFLAGGGHGRMIIDDFFGSELSAKATGGLFHFQIGGEISENLVLFGDLGAFTISGPMVYYQGERFTAKDTEISSFAIGVGLTYYIMPNNMYFSGSLIMAQGKLEEPGFEEESKWGPGILLSIGKEWWVGKQWGLGVAGFFELHMLESKEDAWGYKTDIKNQILGIAFTATMY